MRVIAGAAKGTALVAPRGSGTRPIADRVKETLLDILAPRLEGASVLDLYAGSGAIGIEALSRGADRCTFVEHDRAALAALRTNLERTGLAARAVVVADGVDRFLGGAGAAGVDLAILDPPYAVRAILAPLERLAAQLPDGALVVVKHFWRTEVPVPDGMRPVRVRRFGETSLTFLERSGPAEGGHS